jgi:hypothetical protein
MKGGEKPGNEREMSRIKISCYTFHIHGIYRELEDDVKSFFSL